MVSKFHVRLRQGLSEPEFYGDLVYKLKTMVGSNNYSAQLIKIISHYEEIGYNINVLQRTASFHSWQLCIPLELHDVGSDFRLYDGSDLNTDLYMRWLGPDALAVWGLPVGFRSSIQFYVLLSP